MRQRSRSGLDSRAGLALVLTALAVASMLQLAMATATAAPDFSGEARNSYSWTAGPTTVSDLAPEEFERLLGTRLPADYYDRLAEIKARAPAYAPLSLPSRFDWTDSAAVSPVRDQQCGDCWAQGAVGAMESQLLIRDHDNTLLSVQQGIDCNYGGSSCNGGWEGDVYDIYRVVGAVKQTCYPYVGADGSCAEDTCEIVTKIDGWDYIDTTVESIKTQVMTDGPIAVGMTVYNDFGWYGGGCYEHTGTASVNHSVVIVGWDDTKCSGQGAWHVKNSWGTGWGEAGYFWIKYGSCRIGEGAAIIHYTPRQRVQLVYAGHTVNDAAGDNDGKPDPGETIILPVSLKNKRWNTATNVSATLVTSTPFVQVTTASAAFADVAQGQVKQSSPPHFVFSVDPSCPCGESLEFLISVTCDQGIFTGGFEMLVGDAQAAFSDDCENDLGWRLGVPDDGAIFGGWARKNPNGTLLDSMLVQPELDHTPAAGVRCFVTANFPRHYGVDVGDVDGGKTTLTTPLVDLSQYASARLRYARWYTNDTGYGASDDVWRVDVSSDSGATWATLENVSTSQRAWVLKAFDLRDYDALSDKVLVRFVASDFGQESTVEAAVDHIEVTGCPYWVDVTPPSVVVTAPNGGEALAENTDYQVRWQAVDDYGIRQFRILASYDGGATYPDTLGIAAAGDSALVWHVPSGGHPNCAVRVDATDRGYNAGSDESDAAFAIVRDAAGVKAPPDENLPERITLVGSERNPFTGSTHIFFGLPDRAKVRLAVYDATGRLARELLSGTIEAGYHSTVWDAKSNSGGPVAPGIYFIRFEAGAVSETAKVVLAR